MQYINTAGGQLMKVLIALINFIFSCPSWSNPKLYKKFYRVFQLINFTEFRCYNRIVPEPKEPAWQLHNAQMWSFSNGIKRWTENHGHVNALS